MKFNLALIIAITVFALSILAVGRILVGLIVSNLHQINSLNREQLDQKSAHHRFSVVIPAFNEEKFIRRCVESVLNQTYSNYEIITVDDGSSDQTGMILDQLARQHPKLRVIHQHNQGKSVAINHALKKFATGDLIMVLDADSYLTPDALTSMARRFDDPRQLGVSANVRITRPHNLLEYVQKVEYLLGYRLKGSEELLGIEYIIGGVGSTFRKSAMLEVGGYDTDSITEDIDFTMKMIDHFGNSNRQFGYADDVIAYTPPVSRFSQLLKQRYRWKQGRFKALFKHRRVIFNRDAKYTFKLTFWKLPKVFFEEFLMLIDPLLLLWIIGIVHHFADFSTIFSILGLYYLFAMATFIPEDLKFWERIRLMVVAPLAYLILYVINIVDWISLMRCLFNMKRIANNEDKTAKWQHVDR
ncbi:glycosyltransferase [Limosilactobacillus sp. WILCCON 0053]|uniref:Glycosyltransferase n=1 Tax=Limosilactobacillus allomucosae TaxID=3142938 RepID=A0ABV0I4P6_9LACO